RHVLFFFQAEDGIRDFHVTGVQTCALPICDQMLEVIDEKTGQKAFCRISEIPRNEGISIKNVFGLNDGWVGLSFYDKGLSLIKLAHTEKGFKIIIDSTLYFPEHLFSYGISDKEGNWWITSKSNGV